MEYKKAGDVHLVLDIRGTRQTAVLNLIDLDLGSIPALMSPLVAYKLNTSGA